MGYIGESIPIPLGQKGLLTDLPASLKPHDGLDEALNIELNIAGISKTAGSIKLNPNDVLDSAVVGIHDWWPNATDQRTIAATSGGFIYRDTGDGTFGGAVAIVSGLGTLNTEFHFVPGGSEATGQNKKLFIYHNSIVPKFFDGDASSLTAFTNLAADWASANPTFGISHLDRQWVFGNTNQPHRIYVSIPGDHSDFTTAGFLTFEVYPGEGDRLLTAIVYKGRLYVFKYPSGVYFLDAPSTTTSTWGFKKLDSSFGAGSSHGLLQVLDDLLVVNAESSITSAQATAAFGDIKFGDIFANAKIERYTRENFNLTSKRLSQAVWYSEKKTALFTMKANGSSDFDRILNIDVKNPQQPRFTTNSKDSPNCLALRRDVNEIARPFYGATDGFIFLMDTTKIFTVDGNAYASEFKTPEIDFGFADRRLANMNKIFEFITLVFEGLSNDNLFVDVNIDGEFIETLTIPQFSGVGLDDFELDVDVLDSIQLETRRIPIHGAGKRIQLRTFNSTNNTFRIEQLLIDFRVGDEGTLPKASE